MTSTASGHQGAIEMCVWRTNLMVHWCSLALILFC